MTQWKLPLCDLQLSEDEIQASLDALRSGWLTMGPRTQALEQRFCEETGAAHAVAVSSASAGLHLACLAAGVGPGDEVVVPAFGFVAAAHAAGHCGAEAVFADIASAGQPLSGPAEIESRLSERTRAVIAVHMFGYSTDIEGIRGLCDERGIALIEDCAEAAGARLPNGRWVGTGAPQSVFSFFAKTQLPVGEGGVVLAEEAAVADRLRLLRSHAMTSVTWDRHRGHAETYDITDLGFNYRIDEPRAALAGAHLDHLGERIGRLRETVGAYRERLSAVDGIEIPFGDEQVERAAHFAFPVLVADEGRRDLVRERLRERGIQTTFYPSLTTLSLYRDAGTRNPCPLAEELGGRHLALPISSTMGAEQVELVCGELAAALEG